MQQFLQHYLKWYVSIFDNYRSLGRGSRIEFWVFNLINALLFIVITSIETRITNAPASVIATLFLMATAVPTTTFAIRRMHDVGKPGWYCFIPFYNIILACKPGQKRRNRYGKDPLFTLWNNIY